MGRVLKTALKLLYFFFTDPATTEIYTLSLHDALPICARLRHRPVRQVAPRPPEARRVRPPDGPRVRRVLRSEEHTSELQSLRHLVCRLLLEKKKTSHLPALAAQTRRTQATAAVIGAIS